MCKPCAARRLTAACAHCGEIKPVVSRDSAGAAHLRTVPPPWPRAPPVRDLRQDRLDRGAGPRRRAGHLRELLPDARRCLRRLRPAPRVQFRRDQPPGLPVMLAPGHRLMRALRAGSPVQARWAEGPVCDPCYSAALRHRGRCASCGQQRRLVTPPGPAADTCSDCAGLPAICVCGDCGIEDKLYERGRCDRCSLRRRAAALLASPEGQVPAGLQPVLNAVCAARAPSQRSTGCAGATARHCSPTWRPGSCPLPTKRSMPARGGGPPTFSARCSPPPACCHPVTRSSPAPGNGWPASLRPPSPPPPAGSCGPTPPGTSCGGCAPAPGDTRPRTYTAHAKRNIRAAAGFLTWLRVRDRALSACGQDDIDVWLATGPGACQVRDFLTWAAGHGHCPPLHVPSPAGAGQRHRHQPGPALGAGRTAAARRQHRSHRQGRRLPAAALRPAAIPDRRHDHQPGHQPRRHRASPASATTTSRPRPSRHHPHRAHPHRPVPHRNRITREHTLAVPRRTARPPDHSRPGSESACKPWASTPRPAVAPRCSTSPPKCPRPSSRTSCTSLRSPPSAGHTKPEATGHDTQPN